MSALKTAFLVERHPRASGPLISPVVERLLNRLFERGSEAEIIVPEDRVWDLSDIRAGHDLFVVKSRTPLALSIAGALGLTGARILNTFEAVYLCHDKIAANAILAAAGISLPPSFSAGSAALFEPLLNRGSIWIKSKIPKSGKKVRRISSAADLLKGNLDPYGLPLPYFAQSEAAPYCNGLKVSVAGEKAWAVELLFSAVPCGREAGRPVAISQEIRETALACGRALGLEIYDVDFLRSDNGYTVIDFNAFPDYRGIEEAPDALADYILKCALAGQNEV